ncbi:MAG: GNAT family N-acetyltransferase, partial [Chloroflexota bacterium]|nr:GNAT family N-acetyltransferase [Dehalococcoidia bacterium]MDW8047818.1 GNAT family N-acetyltransferase [Chloroflexota bacterium]
MAESGADPQADVRIRPYRETDVVLRDGTTVHLRAARSEDTPRVAAFYRSLSPVSRHLRFFSIGKGALEERAALDCQVDYVHRFTLLAASGPAAEVVGVASYVRTGPDRAEVAFAVSDRLQGRGLGTLLLAHLAQVAAAHGIATFEGVMLPENYRMLDVLEQSGFPLQLRPTQDEIAFTMPTSFSPEAVERFERREQLAAIAALEAILRPRSVAVIGASRERGTVAGELFHNLLEYGFQGPVYPVNRNARVVQSVLAYPSVDDLPEAVDLAVIAVPAANVPEVAEACGRRGVRAIVVISSGFAEAGPEGRRRQTELVEICRRYGMRLVGPNCMGVINTDASVRLNATFGPKPPRAGRVGFASQSGALGLAIIDYAGALELGLSSFVSLGNKADISANDLLHFWEADDATD